MINGHQLHSTLRYHHCHNQWLSASQDLLDSGYLLHDALLWYKQLVLQLRKTTYSLYSMNLNVFLLLLREGLSSCFRRRASYAAWQFFCHDTLFCLQILVVLLPC